MSYLRLEDVSFISNKNIILKDINLDVNKGEFISIVGKSGSGKSTLLKIIGDLLPYTAGEIYFNGKDYKSHIPTNLRKKITYCFQIPYLFGDTIIDNFNFPYNIRDEKLDLSRVNYLMDLFNVSNLDLDTSVRDLSGGEVQRIALIRSLIFKPEILLLDEITSALDIENKNIVNTVLKKLNNEGMTILSVTHDLKYGMDNSNRILTMENGKIIKKEVL